MKVIAATVVAGLGLGGFNLAVWRRLKAAPLSVTPPCARLPGKP